MVKVLFICSSWPHGPNFGGQLRALHLGRALQHVGPTTVLLVGSEAGDKESSLKTAAEFSVLLPALPHPTPPRTLRQKFQFAFNPRYTNVHGVVATPEDRSRIAVLTGEFDLVWVLNSRTPNILARWRWPRAHLDIDDIPSTYLRTLAANSAGTVHRLQLRLQQQLLKRRELRLKDRFATLSVCSQADRAYLRGGSEIHVIPNGFPRPSAPPERRLGTHGLRIGFIGLFSYAPNAAGVRWFLDQCWPAILQSIPGIRLRLIGRDSDGPLRPKDPNVDALGWVSDPGEEIATWSAMIVPIHFGGGTRIKIAEAFSRECPAVSTSVGAFGYEVEHEKQLLMADEPDDFAAACIRLIQNPELGQRLASRAWKDYLEQWTWDAIAPKVWSAAEDCLRRSAGQAKRA